jgi:hypothetical protein
VHWADGGQVLLDDGLGGSAAFGAEVPPEAAGQAQVGRGVNEQTHIQQSPQAGHGEEQDALHENDVGGLNPAWLRQARMGAEVIARRQDRAPRPQGPEILRQPAVVQRGRVVEVEPGTFGRRPVAVVEVVVVVMEECGPPIEKQRGESVCERGLAAG